MSFNSSNEPIISVESVSKCFHLYKSPLQRIFHLLQDNEKVSVVPSQGQFWALQNISFQLPRGVTMGILGQNGSGKSSLLQIIAGTMTPTSGSVSVSGRIGALLELGSGFNPEFTGKENVFFNASLLGLSQDQTESRFDEIVAFADIGQHLYQPVKTYSTGMLVRLAFAVQVVTDPEVLIIDEALAVGDAKFQLKCFRRLDKLKSLGTTILFVSHAADIVRSFCDVGLVLDKGISIFLGDARPATVHYLSKLHQFEHSIIESEYSKSSTTHGSDSSEPGGSSLLAELGGEQSSFGVGGAFLQRLEVRGITSANTVLSGSQITFIVDFLWDQKSIADLIIREGYDGLISVGIAFSDLKGSYIFGGNGIDFGCMVDFAKTDKACIEVKFQLPLLADGDYFITVGLALGSEKHHVQLKWYDSVMQLKCVKSDRNVYGLIAVDYQMKVLSSDMADDKFKES